MIDIDYADKVAVLKLNNGITNGLRLQLLHDLAEALRLLKANPEVRGIVLSSANDKFFSIGFDIPNLYGLTREDFTTFYQTFNRTCLELYTFPRPTVAAITGHAIAGGCILTLCCDYRYIAEGRKLMGLNEIKLGVPVPYPADCFLRQLVGVRIARDVMDNGDFYQPEESLQMGMVDRVLPLEQVLPEAIEKASTLGTLPLAAFALIKRNRVEDVAAQVQARLEEKERLFVERWYSAEARHRLKDAMEKF